MNKLVKFNHVLRRQIIDGLAHQSVTFFTSLVLQYRLEKMRQSVPSHPRSYFVVITLFSKSRLFHAILVQIFSQRRIQARKQKWKVYADFSAHNIDLNISRLTTG